MKIIDFDSDAVTLTVSSVREFGVLQFRLGLIAGTVPWLVLPLLPTLPTPIAEDSGRLERVEVLLGSVISLRRGRQQPMDARRTIHSNAITVHVCYTELVLRLCDPGLGRLGEPVGCRLQTALNVTILACYTHRVLGRGVALRCGGAHPSVVHTSKSGK